MFTTRPRPIEPFVMAPRLRRGRVSQLEPTKTTQMKPPSQPTESAGDLPSPACHRDGTDHPRASHPARAHHETAPGNRRTSSFVAALRNAMSVIGTVSSDHCFRPARAIASAIRELRFGTREHFPQEHRSARERRPLKAPGAHSSQGAGSTTSGGHDGLQTIADVTCGYHPLTLVPHP